MNIEQSVIDMYEEFMNNISNDDNVQSASNVSMEQNLNNRIENHSDHGDGSINGATNINGNHNDCVNRDDIANHNGSLNPTNDETNNHSPNHNINDNIPGNINNSINQNNNSNTNNIINRDQNEETSEDISYEFNGLSIRTVDPAYRKLPHDYQLITTKTSKVREIIVPFEYQLIYNFTHLRHLETLPLHSIIDVHVKVLRDYGITVGNTNSNMLIRRELHVAQDDVHIKLTLWNDQAKKISGTIINKYLKLKHVKVDWFNGTHTLISMPNTRVAIV
ncbi:unnamed protein product [Rotaria sp. Silwood1]|nr:unnamed protein product [Rotaria sp. Silwood1]